MYLLALDTPAPVSIGARPVEVPVRAMGVEGPALAGPLLFLPSPALLGFGAIAASPAVLGSRVWLVAVDGAQLHLALGTVLGHGVEVGALAVATAPGAPPQPLPVSPVSPAPAQPAPADPPQPSKAKGKAPRAVTPDPTA